MSYKAWDWACKMPVRGARQHVLFWLARHHNSKTGQCTPSLTELAAESGLGVSTIRGHLRGLEADGIIKAEITNGGRHQRSSYQLMFDLAVMSEPETRQELAGNEELKTPQDLAGSRGETRQELSENPPGAGDVGLRPKGGTRGVSTPAADAADPDGGLFAEPPKPRKAATVAKISDRAPVINGGAAVKAWCDAYSESFPGCVPTKEQTGRIGRTAKQLLTAKNPERMVLAAAAYAGRKGSLNLQHEFQDLARRGPRVDDRPSTTDAKVGKALALADQLRQRESG